MKNYTPSSQAGQMSRDLTSAAMGLKFAGRTYLSFDENYRRFQRSSTLVFLQYTQAALRPTLSSDSTGSIVAFSAYHEAGTPQTNRHHGRIRPSLRAACKLRRRRQPFGRW